MTDIPDRPLFKTDEAARIIGVTRQTIYNWIQEGRLAFIRTPGGQYRIPRGEVLRVMGERKGQE